MLTTLRHLITWLHRDEGGFLDKIVSGLFGGLFGGGGGGGGGAPDYSSQLNRQIGLMEEAQRYRQQRQAQLDPLFSELLRRSLMRSRTAPMIGGLRRQPFGALEAPERQLPVLPPPRLLGSTETIGADNGAVPRPREDRREELFYEVG